MTKQNEILNDSRYIPIHNGGFVGLIDTMGSDEDVEQAARVSYAKGTRKVSDTRNLIRYLIRNYHNTPVEMIETKWHIRLPIFCFRQIIRHRTASTNEMSLRYSEAEDDFYIPSAEYVKSQSKNNKQGRSGDLDPETVEKFIADVEFHNTQSYHRYQEHLKLGVARELARIELPPNLYTEVYWKIDGSNLMKFLKLRMDPHTQIETRDYADAMYNLVKPKFPLCFEAFEDYGLHGKNLSRMEVNVLKDICQSSLEKLEVDITGDSVKQHREEFKKKYGLSDREVEEFFNKFKS